MTPPFTHDTLVVTSPNTGGTSLVQNGEVMVLDRFDATGICLSPGLLLRNVISGTQDARIMQLQAVSAQGGKRVLREDALFDFHDVLIHDDRIYLVSSGSNEVLVLDQDGRELNRHAFPGGNDCWHINCLGVWDNQVVLSAFGEFDGYRGYKHVSRGQGFVMELETQRKLWQQLSQPHTPTQYRQYRLVCNSEEKQVLVREPDGNPRCLQFDSYTRGLACSEDYLYVGLSASRNIEGSNGQARIAAIRWDDWQTHAELALPFAEVYDLRCVDDTSKDLLMLMLSCNGMELQQTLERFSRRNRLLEQQLVQFRRVSSHIVAGKLLAFMRWLKSDPSFGQPGQDQP